MQEIPTVEELAHVVREAQSGGQPLTAEELAAVVHAAVVKCKRAAAAARMRSWRANRAARRVQELAQAS